jgi:signal transduction histidine kinase
MVDTKPSPAMRQQLGWRFSAIAIVILAVTAAGVVAYIHLLDARQNVIDRIDPANLLASQLLTEYVDEETGIRGYVLTGQSLFLQPYQQGLANASTADANLRKLLSPRSRAGIILTTVDQRIAAWHSQFAGPAIAATKAGDRTFASNSSLNMGKSLFDQVRTTVGSLQNRLGSERRAAIGSLTDATVLLAAVLIAALAVVVVSGAIAWFALRRRVIEPLEAVAADTKEVTSGHLAHPVKAVGPREIAELAGDIEAMRKRILEEVDTVRKSEEQLAALNADLLRSNEELEQFAYVASHDLQEPLRKVTGFCQLLQQRYGGQLDDRADQYIEFAVDGAKRMQTLINDLLTFSRIERTTQYFEPLSLRDSVRAAVANLESAIEDADASVRIEEPLPTVMGDRGLLISLFQNLIGNGVKFGAPDRPVAVRVRAQPRNESWLIEVEDDGIGIEPRFADRIFVIFQRLHSRDVYAGTGIGLAMCKKIVEFHGGRIWLDVDHHPGARFCFTIPALPEATAEEEEVELDRTVQSG